MSYNKVMELRRRGQWQTALDEALRSYKLLNDEWGQTALFWTVYDLAKLAILIKGGETIFVKCLIIMHDLSNTMIDGQNVGRNCYQKLFENYMPNEAFVVRCARLSKKDPQKAFFAIKNQNIMPKDIRPAFHNSYGWILYRCLLWLGMEADCERVKCLVARYLNLQNMRPSLLHSRMLSYALDYADSHFMYFDLNQFLALWGLENLRDEDYLYSMEQGKRRKPIFDRLCDIVERYDGREAVLSLLDEKMVQHRRNLLGGMNLKAKDEIK